MLTIKQILQTLQLGEANRANEYQSRMAGFLPPSGSMILAQPSMMMATNLQALIEQHTEDLRNCKGPRARFLEQLQWAEDVGNVVHSEGNVTISKNGKNYLALINRLAPQRYVEDRGATLRKLLEIIPVNAQLDSRQNITLPNGYTRRGQYCVWGKADKEGLQALAGKIAIDLGNGESAELLLDAVNYWKSTFVHKQPSGSTVKTETNPFNCFNNWAPQAEILHDALEEESYTGRTYNVCTSAYVKALQALAQEKGFDSSLYRMTPQAFKEALRALREEQPLPPECTYDMSYLDRSWYSNFYSELWDVSNVEGEPPLLKWSLSTDKLLETYSSKIKMEGVGPEITSIDWDGDHVQFTDDPVEFELSMREDKNIGPNLYYVLLTEYFFFQLFKWIKIQRENFLDEAKRQIERKKAAQSEV